MNPLIEQLLVHDLDDTRQLIELAKALPDPDHRVSRLPGASVDVADPIGWARRRAGAIGG